MQIMKRLPLVGKVYFYGVEKHLAFFLNCAILTTTQYKIYWLKKDKLLLIKKTNLITYFFNNLKFIIYLDYLEIF